MTPSDHPWRILIVDDESLARQRLQRLLLNLWPQAHITQASDSAQAQELLGGLVVDVIFLDIHMPQEDGLAWLGRMRAQLPWVVLVSADSSQALRAFDLDAQDYLCKPITLSRLQACLGKLQVRQPPAATPVVLPEPRLESAGTASAFKTHLDCWVASRDQWVRIAWDDVLYWRAQDKALALQTRTVLHWIDGTLQSWQDQLGDQVVRIHRNMLVRLDVIQQLKSTSQGWQILLQGPQPVWLPVSRRQLPQLKQALQRSVQ